MKLVRTIGILLLFCFILALAWVGQKQLLAEPPELMGGWILLLVAAVMFLLLNTWTQQISSHAGNGSKKLKNLFDTSPLGMSLLILGLIYGASTFWFNTQEDMLPWGSLFAWGTGSGLILVGTWRIDRQMASQNHAVPIEADASEPYTRIEILLIIVITIVALLSRQVLVGNIPHNLSGDEAEMGLTARKVLSGVIVDPFATSWLSHPNLWFFLQALSLKLFGDTVGGLRMISVLIGTATVPALYWLARSTYGRTTALLAAALLATYHFHIHYSRNALNNIADPLLALIGFAALLRGFQTRSLFLFAVTGFALGAAQNFYMGARLLPLILIALLVHQLIARPRFVLGLRWHLALLVSSFIIGFGPLMIHFIKYPHVFNARLKLVNIFTSSWFQHQQELGLSQTQIFLNQIRDGFGAYTFVPDRSAQYDPGIALLDPIFSIFFVFGLVLLLTQWRRIGTMLIFAWLIGTATLGGALLASAPASPRYVTTAPVLCLVVAITIVQFEQIIRRILHNAPAWIVRGVGVGIVIFWAVWNTNFYFNDYTSSNHFGWINVEVTTELGLYLQSQPDPPVYVYFFGAPRLYYRFGTTQFLAPDADGIDVEEPITATSQLPQMPYGHRPIFVFLPEREDELEIVRQRYPNGELYQVTRLTDDTPLFVSYEPDGEFEGEEE